MLAGACQEVMTFRLAQFSWASDPSRLCYTNRITRETCGVVAGL